MKHILLATLFLSGLLSVPAIGLSQQTKKILEHADVQRWKKIEQQRISNDGQWVSWVQIPVTEGDAGLQLWNAGSNQTSVFPRASDAQFSADNKLLIFTIKPPLDSLKAQRRKKVKEEDLPKDTLGILTLATGQLEKIPRLKTVLVPEKWSGWFVFQCEPLKPTPAKKDTAKTQPKPSPKLAKEKKEDKDNGYRLVIRNTRFRQTGYHRLCQGIYLGEKKSRPVAVQYRLGRYHDGACQPLRAKKRGLFL